MSTLYNCVFDWKSLMKDRISLIAAAAGGLMLSLAASSIIHAAPVTSLKSPSSVETLHAKYQPTHVTVNSYQ